MEEKISIIVPIYNVEKYIKRCVDSILKQTYKKLEILLVDDGSPDNCGKICDEYKKIDKRVKVIHKKNGGLSDARNKGIENATGKYIMFVDSDDYIEIDMVEYLYRLLKKNKCEIAICNYIYDYSNKDKNYIAIDGTFEKIYNSHEAIKELLKDETIKSFAWNKLYRTELFQNIKFPVKRLMEDVATTYKLFMNANKIVFGSEPKYHYVQREGSILHNKKANFYIDFYEMAYERYKNIMQSKYKNIPENKISMLYVSFNFTLVQNKEVKQYIKENNVVKRTKELITDIYINKYKVRKTTRIKMFIYRKNTVLFKILFRGWNKWILKQKDFM